MEKIINLTPHTVRLLSKQHEKLSIPAPVGCDYWYLDLPSEGEARVNVEEITANTWAVEMQDNGPPLHAEWLGLPIKKIKFGEVTGLPARKSGVQYLVSRLVKQAVPDRDDCFVPHDVVRDENGVIVGCLSLAL
jgi:hypothetical protein